MWQVLVVIIIVCIALFFVIRRFIGMLDPQASSACGCCTQNCEIYTLKDPDNLSQPSCAKQLNENEQAHLA